MSPKPAIPQRNAGDSLSRGLRIAWFLPEGQGSITRDPYERNDGSTMAGVTWGVSEGGRMVSLAAAAAPPYIRSTRLLNLPRATVAIRFRVASLPAVNYSSIGGFFNGTASTTADKLILINSANKLEFYAFSGGGKHAIAAAAITTNQWYTAVGTADGTNLTIYQDGVKVGSVACGATFTSYTVPNFMVGCSSSDAVYKALSQDVEFAVMWDRALSPAEVARFTADPGVVVRAPQPSLVLAQASSATYPMLERTTRGLCRGVA